MYEELKLVGNICKYEHHLHVFYMICIGYIIMLVV